jgi:hypothetical protein
LSGRSQRWKNGGATFFARIANGVFGKEIDAAHAMEGPEVTGAPEKDGTIEVAAPGTGQVEGNEVESSLTVLPSM